MINTIVAESCAANVRAAPLLRQRKCMALLAVWMACVLIGMYWMWRYESTPGAAETTQGVWPMASAIVPATDRPTLLMFLHPQCPCSRASLTELKEILAECAGPLDVRILFYQPSGVSDAWWQTDIYALALTVPGARVSLDRDLAEGHCFGARTSGHTVLFTSDGRQQFAGGITAGRGHVGQNAGRNRRSDLARKAPRHLAEPGVRLPAGVRPVRTLVR